MADEHDLPYFQLMGTHQLGVALAGGAEAKAGLSLMLRASAICPAIGVEIGMTGTYMRIAEASLMTGDVATALEAIDNALVLGMRRPRRTCLES